MQEVKHFEKRGKRLAEVKQLCLHVYVGGIVRLSKGASYAHQILEVRTCRARCKHTAVMSK